MERTKDGLKADPRGAPVSTAPFPELAGESAAVSMAEIDPAKVLGRRRVDGVPVWPAAADVAEGVVRAIIVAHGAGGGGGLAHQRRRPAWKVRGLRFGRAEPMVMVGRKGNETSPPKPIPGMESSQSLRGREEGGGRV